MVQAGLLKKRWGGGGGGEGVAHFLFNFFKAYHFYIFTFRNYFTLCEIVLYI